MKTPTILLAACILIYISCKKTKNDNPAPQPANSTPVAASCTINGAAWTSDSAFATLILDTAAGNKSLTCIGFDDSTNVGIAFGDFIVSDSLPDDTINFPSSNCFYEGYKNGVFHDSYMPVSGRILFTKHDTIAHKVSVWFEGVLIDATISDTIVITNGQLTNISYDIIMP